MKLKVKPDPETNAFNITINFINEQEVHFDVDPDQQAEFELEIVVTTQNLTAIEVNGVNQTITFPSPNTNKVTVDDVITDFKLFLPQNTDTEFATFGRTLEGDFLNNFTKDEFDRVQGLAELYNLDETNINNIINFTTIDLQKAYEIGGKMKLELGFFTPDSNLTKAGQAYIDGIGNATTFAEIFDKIEERIRNETGSGGAGDNPDFGVKPPPT
jgi:hypothetical protein